MKHTKMQAIALERIYRLFELAQLQIEKNPERSKRYISLARKISTKARSRIPDELKTRFCKKCDLPLQNGKNAQIRKEGAITIVRCLACGFERKAGRKATSPLQKAHKD